MTKNSIHGLIRVSHHVQVEEEIGYDITGHVRPEDYLEVEIAEQRCRLYIVSGVEESTPFLTRTKKEIGVRVGMLSLLNCRNFCQVQHLDCFLTGSMGGPERGIRVRA